MLLYQHLLQTAQKDPSRIAIRYLGKELRPSDVTKKVAQLSYLYQTELGPKARMALLSSNSPAVPLSFLALTNTRTPLIPLSPALGFEELGKCLRQSGATHLGVSSDRVSFARDLLRTERLNLPVVEIERKQGGEYDSSYRAPPDNQPKETDSVLLLRTAGASGEPKFAAFDHKSLSHAAQTLKNAYRLGSVDRVLTPMNWSHPFAWMHGMLFPMLGGATCVVDEGLEGTEFIRFLTENAVTRLQTDVASTRALLALCTTLGSRMPRLKAIVLGPGATPGGIKELKAAAAPLGIVVVPTYGQTESLWAVGVGSVDPKEAESVQILAGLKIKILDDNHDEIVRKQGKARTGRLAVSGPVLMTGYQGKAKEENEKATRNAIRGTWLYTGDVAELSGDGETLRLRWVGRTEELLESKGSTPDSGTFISAEPIDPVACAHAGVEEAAGFVMKDVRGKRVLACAVRRQEGSTIREDAVLAHCRASLPAAQAPSHVFFTEAIPRAAVGGTVNRFRLAQQFNGLVMETAAAPITGLPGTGKPTS